MRHFLRRSTWITNFTLYTVELEISRAFQPYIRLYTYDLFSGLKRHDIEAYISGEKFRG